MYKLFLKQILDFVFSLLMIILLSPIIIFTTVVLLVTNKGKIFFLQVRPGLNSKPFKIIKFKTMLDLYDDDGNPLQDELRLTKTGLFIRSLSLDELLQLINVIKGDMSLVGPRPLLTKYLEFYSSEQIKRHNVKPGITGLAQINGRNNLTWEEKFRLDLEYVDKISFMLDLKILLITILKVIQRKGINSFDHATMKEFDGK